MASISTSIPTSSPSLSVLQKPSITTHGSPVLRFQSRSKMRKLSCSLEGKPDVISDEDSVPSQFIVPGKNSWPELVGEKGEVAKAIIEKENPLVNAIILSENSPMILNYVSNRVWVVVNTDGVVIRTPTIG
ncbi:hypothetical protein M8C21_016220 [Ambrosia artemisiifolia]|uniref:Uncharacterized protein n=1 Tax=Ambrosia artemisiifolia TaxID=4212 RepID=A0AAD5BNE0_AMBAR|nr:hypothetical protein M8C21_016220 [Ambrosia artemisiifolia]